MGIITRNKGVVRHGGRRALMMAAAVGAAACWGQTARASDYLVDPNWAGSTGVSATDTNGITYAGIWTTMQTALGATGVNSGASATNVNRLYIDPGTYMQTTSLSYSKNNVDLIGIDGNAADVVITSTLDSDFNTGAGTLGTTNCSTVQLKGNNQSVANITFANSTDTPYIHNTMHEAETPTGGFQTGTTTAQSNSAPAVALLTQGDEQAFNNVQILGFQDTLYMKGGRNYYTNSYISGDNDFIFANGTSEFVNNTINIDGDHSGGQMTAASTDKRTSNGLVFITNTIQTSSVTGSVIDPMGAASLTGAAPNTMGLGRPWGWQQTGGDSSVVLISNKMTNAIITAGWTLWNNNQTLGTVTKDSGNPAEDARYAEYNSMDLLGNPLDVSGRVTWSHQLNATQAAAYTNLLNVFASEYNATSNPGGYAWFDGGYANANSWPSFWGTRNLNNDIFNEIAPNGLTGNPSAYSNPNWTLAAAQTTALALNWDPSVGLATVPEPGTISLLGGASAMLLVRRRRAAEKAE